MGTNETAALDLISHFQLTRGKSKEYSQTFYEKLFYAIANNKLFNIESQSDGKCTARVRVSCQNRVGMIVGRQGHNIIGHINEKECEVQNPQPLDDPIFTLTCKDQSGLYEMALWILDEDDKFNTSSNRNNIEKKVRCCTNLVGLLVGTSGETIKKIQEQSNCTIQSPPREDIVKKFSISGTEEQVEKAYEAMRSHVQEKYTSNETMLYNPKKSCDCQNFDKSDLPYVLKCDEVFPLYQQHHYHHTNISPDNGYSSLKNTYCNTAQIYPPTPPQQCGLVLPTEYPVPLSRGTDWPLNNYHSPPSNPPFPASPANFMSPPSGFPTSPALPSGFPTSPAASYQRSPAASLQRSPATRYSPLTSQHRTTLHAKLSEQARPPQLSSQQYQQMLHDMITAKNLNLTNNFNNKQCLANLSSPLQTPRNTQISDLHDRSDGYTQEQHNLIWQLLRELKL